MMMLSLLDYKDALTLEHRQDGIYVYDIIRKKYVLLLPEEFVRQVLVHYLIKELSYPQSRIQVERGVETNRKMGRYDIIIYDKAVQPWMLIECKSHRVQLDQKVFDQLGGYNLSMQAPFYLVSNGITTYCYQKTESGYEVLNGLPEYS